MCLFCKIASHQQEAEIVFEDEQVVVFKDIVPRAPVHLLVVPKKHIASINEIQKNDAFLLGHMFLVAKKLAEEKRIKDKGYRLIFNVGRGGGQVVDHIHLHLVQGNNDPNAGGN